MARRLSITDTHVWDRLEGCMEEAITIEGRHESLADFLVHHPAEEVTSYFTEIVAMLEHRGIENYHLVLKHAEDTSMRENEKGYHLSERRRAESKREASQRGVRRRREGSLGSGGMREDGRGEGYRRRVHRPSGASPRSDGSVERGSEGKERRNPMLEGRDRRRWREEGMESSRGEEVQVRGRRQRRDGRDSRSRSRNRAKTWQLREGGRERGGRGGTGRGRSQRRRCGRSSSRSRSRSLSPECLSCAHSLSPPSPAPCPFPTATPTGPPKKASWAIVVYHGGSARKDFSGPLAASSCMSCDLGTSMQMGLTGSGSGGLPAKASLIYEDEHMRYWHDAKGRPLFVVTPLRHVHNLKELTGAEMHRLWSGAMRILTDMGCDPKQDMRDMILNAGVDRNHAHLHLKVRVTGSGFDRARAKWSERRNRLVDALRTFARKQSC